MLLDHVSWLLADLYIFGNVSALEGLTIWQVVKVLSIDEFWKSQDKQRLIS